MTTNQLPHYLLANRKRLSLSQDEVAFLLGRQSGAKVSRYESFTREPGLKTALALEVIYQKPVRELFGGLYQEVEREVMARAKALAATTDRLKPTKRTARKRQMIEGIVSHTQSPTTF